MFATKVIRSSVVQALQPVARRMVSGAIGPVVAAVALFALPIFGAAVLPADEFAVWAILGSIATVSMSLDFGGVALAIARFDLEHRLVLFGKATAMTSFGSLVVGMVAALAWIPFSTTEAAQAFSFTEGLAAIGVTTVACALRGSVLVLAQFALSGGVLRLRNTLLVGQAFGAATITAVVALATGSAWALPAGWLGGAVLMVTIGSAWAYRAGLMGPAPAAAPGGNGDRNAVLMFGGYRALATVISAFLLQSDRWIVGALGGPVLLGAYEIAWRAASMPRFLVEQLSAILGSDAASKLRASDPIGEIAALWRKSERISLVAAAGVGVAFVGAYPLITGIADVETEWPIFLAMIVVFTVQGMTAPGTFIALGTARPSIDAKYLLLALAGSLAATVAGLTTGSVSLYVAGNLLALLAGCVWFFRYAPRDVRAHVEVRIARARAAT